MEQLVVYIPMDRRHALARSQPLPDRTWGTALFADISGFTPLTEALVQELGTQRGAEELTNYLNLVYDAVIEELHRYGGSVIAFAGDAITCWFDGDDGLRATNCALAMQAAMRQFAAITTVAGNQIELSMKASVATGTARRFLVGDPAIRVLDAVAGSTVTRLAAAERQAQKGEVILDETTLESVGGQFAITDVRNDLESGLRFGVMRSSPHTLALSPWPHLDITRLDKDAIRSWLLRPVYERINHGLEEFLAELRPTAALFLRFGGIDYDGDDDAGQKLDAYVRWVQHIVAQYEGTFIDLNIGDKGSYIYINFGAPIAHENNAAHAASAALALLHPPQEFADMDQVQMGISQGHMRAGIYGGTNHRTYGVLGDEVNMAARLMMKAEPGQILVSEVAQGSIADEFVLQRLPRIRVKGKREPVAVYALEDRRTPDLIPPSGYALPLVGRVEELARVAQLLEQTQQGEGQIIVLTGEAGVGKSRLVAEIVRRVQIQGWRVHSGACESYGANSSYLVWHPIWRRLLTLEPMGTAEEQITAVTNQCRTLNPSWVQRVPLLDVILQIPIPDNTLTQSLDAKLRKASLHYLLVDLFRAKTAGQPALIVLEDCDWLDSLSYELLQVISRAAVDRPVCIVLAFRELIPAHSAEIINLPYTTHLHLNQFSTAEATELIALKLSQLAGTAPTVKEELVERLVEQSQGNPFYLEELATYLYYRGLSSSAGNGSMPAELPDSLHRLVLSRLDQLSESQKVTARVASVIGRVFRAAWLWGAYPALGDPEQVQTDLFALYQQDLTVPEPAEPELTYFFKQVITQSVTYESLPYAMRSTIHDQIGRFVEQTYEDTLDQFLDLLAYHYDHSNNIAKRCEYLLRAAEAAQAQYANQSAIDYYRRALPLVPPEKQIDVQLKLGRIYEVIGQWHAAREHVEQALASAEQLDDRRQQAWCETAMGELFRKQGHYEEAAHWLEQARVTFETLSDRAGVGQVLHYQGTLADQQGNYQRARALYHESLQIRRTLGDKRAIGSLLSNLGIVARRQGDLALAQSLYAESLEIRRTLGDKWAIAVSLNNLGNVLLDQERLDDARLCLEEAVALQREVGDRGMLGNALNNLGNVARTQRDHITAHNLYSESLTIYRELGDKYALAYLLEDVGWLVAQQNQGEAALRLVGAAEILREEIGGPLTPREEQKLQEALAPTLRALEESVQAKATAEGRTMALDEAIAYALACGYREAG
ncbi:MAG: tetratricopeptide repeat protein [Caldilineaceae bacterium]|nr:tetratricopeptide repeat protein [Caldilineaceae bacterium]